MAKRVRVAATKVSRLMEWLQQHEDEMAALLGELVAIPTENPPGRNYRACANLLEDRLRLGGLECERFETSKQNERTADSPICLIGNYGRGEPALYFPRHHDLFPAPPPAQSPPTRKGHS